MTDDDRRAYPRLRNPLEGSWRDAAGEMRCRIADLSWGGCFLETVAEPEVGQETLVTISAPTGPVHLPATVVTVERGIGFAVKFQPLTPESRSALYLALGEPSPPGTLEWK